jgi:hypothetical protein
MRKAKKNFILIGILLLSIVMYFLYPKSGSFDNLVFEKINKNSITEIRIIEQRSDYDDMKKIEETETIQNILSKLCNLNIIQYKMDIPKDWNKVYDIEFSNNYKAISDDKEKPVYDLTISFYDTGYITVYGEGTLKAKNYKIINDSDIKHINELLSQFS